MGVDAMGCCFEARRALVRGKRRLRRLFWKLRAEIKRQMEATSCRNKNNNFNFHYDPFSYSLNFDNGNFGFFC